MMKWRVQAKTHAKQSVRPDTESDLQDDGRNNQMRTSCSLDFLNEIRGQNSDTLSSNVSFNPSGIFDQGGNKLSPVTPPPRHRYISPERRQKAGQSTPSSVASTPTPAKAVFILQKSDSRESVHIDVSIIDDGVNPHQTLGSNVTSTTTLPSIRSTEVGDDETPADNFKFSRTRSMRGPKGLRISKLFPQGKEQNISDSTAALTFSSEDEGKGNSDQSESPPPLPPRRHRSRPGTAMSYRGGQKHTDTNSISSEESFPSIPCLATDLHKLRVSGDVVPPAVPPKSPMVTRIEVTGEPVKPTVISTESAHSRSRSEVLGGSSDRRPSPVKKNVRTKSSDNIIRRRNQTKKSDSSDSVDEGIVVSTPPKGRSQSAGRTRKLSEEIECYNVYNVRTGKITTSVQKPTDANSSTLTKRSDRHQNCKKCIHATKS